MFRKGGLFFISKEDIIKTLQKHSCDPHHHMNRTNDVRHYSFGHQSKEKSPCYQTMLTISDFMFMNDKVAPTCMKF